MTSPPLCGTESSNHGASFCPSNKAPERPPCPRSRLATGSPPGRSSLNPPPTPWAPFSMPHVGGQGDSGGVGAYLAVGVQRTRYHRGVLLRGLDPRTGLAQAGPAQDDLLYLPVDDWAPLLELGYSDDRRQLAASDAGLAWGIDVLCHTCWAAGGSAKWEKLRIMSRFSAPFPRKR